MEVSDNVNLLWNTNKSPKNNGDLKKTKEIKDKREDNNKNKNFNEGQNHFGHEVSGYSGVNFYPK